MRIHEFAKQSLQNRTTDTLTSTIEEIVNATTHGIGVILGILGMIFLLPVAIQHNKLTEIVGVTVFCLTLIILYITSTLYHSFYFTPHRKVLRIIDHSAIFIFIAGSYTPFTLMVLNGNIEWILLLFVWLFAVGGIFFNIYHIDKKIISLFLYFLLGWISVVVIKPLLLFLPQSGFLFLLFG